jgi:hypothetical protein
MSTSKAPDDAFEALLRRRGAVIDRLAELIANDPDTPVSPAVMEECEELLKQFQAIEGLDLL